MIKLTESKLVISISGSSEDVVSKFLMVFLSQQKLTDRQLQVTTSLVSRYAVYVSEGVKEPYASQLLFSTETRKAVCKSLGIGSAHLTNTFGDLCKKEILARENNQYSINPALVPNDTLLFKFKIDEQPRQIREGSGITVRTSEKRSKQNNKERVLESKSDGQVERLPRLTTDS